MRTLLPGVLAAFTLLSAACGDALAQSQRNPAPIAPRMVVRDALLPVRLEAGGLRTEVIGHAAQTRVELVFRNPNARVLEGELQFPLAEGQSVSGFSLDINGELRPAVPVEKAKGQQVFEDVIRARVDPALLELTQGNNYKLRVYPLPPHGTRRIVLVIDQLLGADGRLVLPLNLAERVPRLDAEIRVADARADEIVVDATGGPAPAFVRSQSANGWAQLSLHQQDFTSRAALSIRVPARHEPLVATQSIGGQTYFYAELPMTAHPQPRRAPRRIALLWDASGSGAARDHGREFALLDAYFKALGQVEVSLTVGRDLAEAPQTFTVKRGRWDALRKALDSVAYDGASNLRALRAADGHDLALLFSDGLSNWGDAASPMAANPAPLYAVSASASVDARRLGGLAEASGGQWLDLNMMPAAEASRALQQRRPRLIAMQSNQARQLVAASPYAEGGHLLVAGVLAAAEGQGAELTFELDMPKRDGGSRIERRSVSVRPQGGATQVAQRWAGLRVAELLADHEANRGEIRRLGKAFGLVTPETSLIVLDAVADYARFEIEPPLSLRADYERLLTAMAQRTKLAQGQHLDRVAARFAEQVAWWEKDFPKDDMPAQQAQDQARLAGGVASAALMRRELAAPSAPAPALREADSSAERVAQASANDSVARFKSASAKGEAKGEGKGEGNGDTKAPAPATIRLTPWAPDAPYARRLREAAPELVYQRYLDERPDFVHSTAFYLDAADVLFAKGRPALALRVLSNLAEMDLENRHVLRVLGYRLLQAKQAQLAIPVLQAVQRLSPNEPQSYRDLGLAMSEAQRWQDSAEQLWQVISRPWDGRFPDVDMLAVSELNAVIEHAARAGRPVRTDAFDKRLLRNLPLDLRITLAWDADNTDIDLWVIDPNGEKAYYGHRFSYQGGRVSHDVTGGYGPEEFALRVAKPGKYTVQAQFYGHRQQIVAPATTLMMKLSTGFGRADQKDEMVTLRLAGQSDMVTVGSFEVGE